MKTLFGGVNIRNLSKKISIGTQTDAGRFPKRLFSLSVLISLLGLVMVLIFYKQIPPQIPLYYGLPEGKSQIAPTNALFIPCGISFFFVLINFSIARVTKDVFLQKSLYYISISISVMALITTLKILFLVGNI